MKFLKVKILPGETFQYPDFNKIDTVIRYNLTWTKYIDAYGLGWHYDKIIGLGKHLPEMFAATGVPDDFAKEAIRLFPDTVKELTEKEFEDFYDNRSHINEPIEILDTDVLQGIAARVQLEEKGIAKPPSSEIIDARAKCLDPDELNHRGIRKNTNRYWKDYKKSREIK